MLLYADVTEIRQHQKQLEHLAHFDPLSKLPNRLQLEILETRVLEENCLGAMYEAKRPVTKALSHCRLRHCCRILLRS